MAFGYYAKSMHGSDRWQVVCKSFETGFSTIVGENLSLLSARQIAEDSLAASGKIKTKSYTDEYKLQSDNLG